MRSNVPIVFKDQALLHEFWRIYAIPEVIAEFRHSWTCGPCTSASVRKSGPGARPIGWGFDSRAELQQHWREHHAQPVKRVNITRRCVQLHSLAHPECVNDEKMFSTTVGRWPGWRAGTGVRT